MKETTPSSHTNEARERVKESLSEKTVDMSQHQGVKEGILFPGSEKIKEEYETRHEVVGVPDRSPSEVRVIHQGYALCDFGGGELRKLRARSKWEDGALSGSIRRKIIEKVRGEDRTKAIERGGKVLGTDFENFWPTTEGNRISKVRYVYLYNDKTPPFEVHVDVYRSVEGQEAKDLSGLIVAEIEFQNEEDVQHKDRILEDLGWLSEDFTQIAELGNSYLATHGLDEKYASLRKNEDDPTFTYFNHLAEGEYKKFQERGIQI